MAGSFATVQVLWLWDTGEDGLSWWANTSQGTGLIRFKSATSVMILRNFGSDFGGQVYQQFTVGLTNSTNDTIAAAGTQLNVYPNPTDGNVAIDFNLAKPSDGTVEVFDLLGNVVYTYAFTNTMTDTQYIDLSFLSSGMYMVVLSTAEERVTQRLLIQ
jgi:hypothetical protein